MRFRELPMVLQDLLGSVGDHVDAARKPVRSELLASQSVPCHGALREIMVSDDHARLARNLRDCVSFSAARWPDECNDTRRVAAKEGNHFCGGHRSYK